MDSIFEAYPEGDPQLPGNNSSLHLQSASVTSLQKDADICLFSFEEPRRTEELFHGRIIKRVDEQIS